MKSVAERFDSKVRRGEPEACWLWTGASHERGYGLIRVDGKLTRATHVALHLDSRPRTGSLSALHSCDNPQCVNPKHLRWGTQKNNIADVMARGRHARAGGMKKLTGEQLATIPHDARSNAEIAREYGVHKTRIGQIKRAFFSNSTGVSHG